MNTSLINEYKKVETPCHIININKLTQNLELLQHISKESGCKLLMAIKGFSFSPLFKYIRPYIDGVSSSGLYESILGFEEFRKEVHVYSAEYKENEFQRIVKYCDYIVFNSFSQLQMYADHAVEAGRHIGIRINPEVSTVKKATINPCCENSRLGVTLKEFQSDKLKNVDGFYFHTMCE